MINQETFSFILWGAYVWFALGVLLIAVPAVRELIDLIFRK